MVTLKKWNPQILRFSLLLTFISITALFLKRENATDAYLSSWSFWIQFPLGALAITLLNDLTGGQWGSAARPVLLSMMKSLNASALLFIPLLFQLSQVFPWLENSLKINQNQTLKFREFFYHAPFFSLRATVYFLAIMLMIKHAAKNDRNKRLSACALFFYVCIMSLASIDWYMSREPEWFSTIYSLIWIIAQVCTAFALILAVKYPGFLNINIENNKKSAANTRRINSDHGAIFFVFLVLWAYLSFMQFLIMWSANLPKEIIWYQIRLISGWQYLIFGIITGSLIIPFFLLLNKRLKPNPKFLSLIAIFVLIFRFFDTAWIILPASRPGFLFCIWDLISFLGIGGIFLSLFFKELTIQTHLSESL